MTVVITPIAENHFEGLYHVLDVVAREKRYLAFIQAPPKNEAFAFYRRIVNLELCHFVALRDGVVIGWCDILPTHGQARAHVGTLGIGLVPDARHAGIGTRLIETALAKADAKGLTRVELTVRTDNLNARALYERFGFSVEGINHRAFQVDGQFFDAYVMALLR